jgi:tetratricopeptide (TPR) repeat protein
LSILGDDAVIPSNYFKRPLATAEYIMALPNLTNRMYVGHIWYSEDIANKMSSIPKIVLIRDPRDNVVSYAHFMDSIAQDVFGSLEYWKGKDRDEKLSAMIFGLNSPVATFPSVYNSYLNYGVKWIDSKTLIVRYEDIIGTKLGGDDASVLKTMNSIMDFVGVEIDEGTLARKIMQGSDPSKSQTFRSGGAGKWRQEFKPQHVTQMKVGAPNLVSTLSYESDENWDLSTKTIKRMAMGIKLQANSLANVRPIDFSQYMQIRKEIKGKIELERVIDGWALNNFIENARYQDAIFILEELLKQMPSNPSWNYLYALCLHQIRKDSTRAIHHYNIALQHGYDEFWVKYNRGLLLIELGDKQAAQDDLERAIRLNPQHKEAREMLITLQTAT